MDSTRCISSFVEHILQVITNKNRVGFGPEVVKITKKFVEIRYHLLPYLYTMFWQCVNEGIPMLKPLVYYDQEDLQTHYRTDEFIYGNQILVCPLNPMP
jgi:alpha-glucosidase